MQVVWNELGRARASSVEDHRRKPTMTRETTTQPTRLSVIRTKPTNGSPRRRATLDTLSDLLPPVHIPGGAHLSDCG
jgi:hypothetical protein